MTANRETILERVRALLAMAEHAGSNEFEAALAAERAQALLFKYNLSMAEIEVKDETDVGLLVYPAEDEDWRHVLMDRIAKTTSCQVVRRHKSFNIGDNRTFVIFGQPANIKVVVYLYEYLAREILAVSPRPLRSKVSNAFRIGACDRLYQRMKATFTEFAEATPETRALVRTTDLQVKDLVSKTFSTRSSSSNRVADDIAYRNGKVAGDGIALRRGIDGSTNAAGQRLLA